jgi:cellulose synthase/poly-beta-1,6-N-acetylglucosamine synthase-like glycosyltransferase/spore germination protein YaaH/peptidoglycan/xylan/chitin deacetylase (PgdA/CDA1 family)
MIFEDPSRLRWRTTLAVSTSLLVVAIVATIMFGRALNHDAALSKLATPKLDDAPTPADDDPAGEMASVTLAPRPRELPRYPAPLTGKATLLTGFVVQDDPRSMRRLSQVGSALDVVFPDYFSFDAGDGDISTNILKSTPEALKATGALVIPRITNTLASGAWSSEAMTDLLASPSNQRKFIDTLIGELVACGAAGVNIDIESLEPSDSVPFLDFLALLGEALHRNKLYLTVDVPLNEEQYDYEVIAKLADAVVVMAYDEHFPTGTPGSIAGLEWFNDGVRPYLSRMPPEKVIVALGAYGYDWPEGGNAQAISFDEAIALGVRNRASIQTENDSVNSFLRYTDVGGVRHRVHFLDAVSVWNQLAFLSDDREVNLGGKSLGGLSVWRLGLDDPGIWPLLAAPNAAARDMRQLQSVPAHAMAMIRGKGDLFRVTPASNGLRTLSTTGNIVNYAEYAELPEPTTIERLGASGEGVVVLTFDDGPDPAYTGPLLDLLKREKVPAAFFLVGSQAKMYPELVNRELAEGHLIGNHTYLHPKLETISIARLHDELNSTQRIIEAATGRQTLLFRSPYNISSLPTTQQTSDAFAEVSRLGYLCVGANVGAEDYWPRMTPEKIAQQVVDQFRGPGPFVVCLHDAGGERSRTVAAVEKLIPMVRDMGMRFGTLSDLTGLPAETLNPPIPSGESLAVSGDRTLGFMVSFLGGAIFWVFLGSTIIAIIRIVGLGIVIVIDRQLRRERDRLPAFTSPVTVLVPAYNESKVIARTIEAILHSDHPDVHVLVLDDGSHDDTAAIAQVIANRDPRVRVITKPNGGKADALNVGFRAAKTDIVVVIDADTIILPTTISRLVAPFVDEKIDAVCGNVQVGNTVNFLTRIQDVEYVTCQNYDRRAFDVLNCIGVVPGATGAWRRQAVLNAGGYSHDTLTEDADLTIAVLRNGHRIVYAPEAKSVTEVPSTFGTLYKQRFRWAYGTFQTLWKHRSAFGRGTLGWIGMPNHLIFQVLFPMLAPIGDAVLIYSMITGQWSAVASGYFMFIGMDLLGSGIALKLDHRPLTGLWTVFLQRFCHRQFMYYVTFAAALACLRGGRHGWNKLERQANVSIPVRLATVTIAQRETVASN